MNMFFMRVLLPIFAAISLISAGQTFAADSQYYYYDGNNKITLTLDPALLMDFSGSTPSSVQAALPDATPAETVGTASLYNVPQNKQNSEVVSKLLTAGNNGISPVFYRGAAVAGQIMALPGGVIVNFNAGWSDAQVREWAAAKGYTVRQQLSIPGNWYVIQTPSGLTTLNFSNAIHESGEVISANPNWWRGVVSR